jgi:Tfp pilus assembly protein PilN
MIRINLLGQTRPKTTKQSVPIQNGLPIILGIAAVVIAGIVLFTMYLSQKKQLDDTNARIASLRAEKASLQQVKQDVDRFEEQKKALQTQIDVIEGLQKNRTGAQELLQMVDQLWLTSLERNGDSLSIGGEAGNINSVANFMTQLKRSGYFDKIEIQEAKEDDVVKSVTTYGFTMTANVAQTPTPEATPQTKATSTPTPPPAPAAKGRS